MNLLGRDDRFFVSETAALALTVVSELARQESGLEGLSPIPCTRIVFEWPKPDKRFPARTIRIFLTRPCRPMTFWGGALAPGRRELRHGYDRASFCLDSLPRHSLRSFTSGKLPQLVQIVGTPRLAGDTLADVGLGRRAPQAGQSAGHAAAKTACLGVRLQDPVAQK